MTLYSSTVPQLEKMLTNLTRWLDKAAEHAKAKSFEPDVLLQSRLAPNQYPLVRQIQGACDGAKFIAARLSAKDPPVHADTEKTFDEIRARVATVLEYLKTFKPSDFEGADQRIVPLGFMPGKGLAGSDYATEFALPNFYFHITTAYAILRHNGVDLGKADYIGSLNIRDL